MCLIVRANSSCLIAWTETSRSFPAFRLKQKHVFFLDLELANYWTETYIISCPVSQVFRLRLELYHQLCWSPAGHMQTVGLLCFHNLMSQSLQSFIRNLFMYIFCWICFFGTLWLMHLLWKCILNLYFFLHPHNVSSFEPNHWLKWRAPCSTWYPPCQSLLYEVAREALTSWNMVWSYWPTMLRSTL